eukprot:SAG31_NODE_2050_length_6560_cov_2.712119_6_plen_184_part_00
MVARVGPRAGWHPSKGLLSRFCATIREIRDFNREIYGTNRDSVTMYQTVATAVRELLNPWDGWTIGGQKVGYGRTNGQEPEPGEVAVLALGADAAAAVSARVASAAPLRVRQQPLDLRLGEPVGEPIACRGRETGCDQSGCAIARSFTFLLKLTVGPRRHAGVSIWGTFPFHISEQRLNWGGF